MTCQVPRMGLLAYVHGQLDREAAEATRLHLAGCAACAAEVRRLRCLSDLLTCHLGWEAAPAGLEFRVADRLHRAARWEAPRPDDPQAEWAGAGALAAASLAVVFYGAGALYPQAYAFVVNQATSLVAGLGSLAGQLAARWSALGRATSAIGTLLGWGVP